MNTTPQETYKVLGSKLKQLPDPITYSNELQLREPNHCLWVHEDVMSFKENSAEAKDVRKRLNLVLEHLAAHGRTGIVKGCKDEANSGWRRSPLGGGNGMHFYLWWAPKGSSQVEFSDLTENSIVVREIRHHDTRSRLMAGNKDDYMFFGPKEFLDQTLGLEPPWTAEQKTFIYDETPFRLLIGQPGAGKTTALWKSIEARADQKVLYLTFSQKLIEFATEHFKTFAPTNADIRSYAFAAFIGEILREDVERPNLAQSQADFLELIADPYIRKELGPWKSLEKALYAEVRAFLFGQAIPEKPGVVLRSDMCGLSNDYYLALRGDKVGQPAANALLAIMKSLESRGQQFSKFFPELLAAGNAIQRINDNALPEGLCDFDRVVVDEVQDLTLLEMTVVVDLCRVIKREDGYAPWLLMAGDEGQTAYPSGFKWADLKNLFFDTMGSPAEINLQQDLRCPEQIDALVQKASGLYTSLDKGDRPTKQHDQLAEQNDEAHIFNVEIETKQDTVDLLKQLEKLDNLVVISLDDAISDWLPDELRDFVMEPAEAKGMEYQSVCVLNPGKLLMNLASKEHDVFAQALNDQHRRTTIDRFRVALSRATETLVLLDVEPTKEQRAASISFFEQDVPYNPHELVKHFRGQEISIDEKVFVRIVEAEELVEERPWRAWKRACEAVNLLKKQRGRGGVNDKTLRHDAYVILLKTAAHILIKNIQQDIEKPEVLRKVKETLRQFGSSPHTHAFQCLETWCTDRTKPPFDLLDAIISLNHEGKWLRDVLPAVSQTLRDAVNKGPVEINAAKRYTQNVEEWLKLTTFSGDEYKEARTLRCYAVYTLISAGLLAEAEHVSKFIEPKDSHTAGLLREAQGQHYEAAKEFVEANEPENALRNFRAAGMWKEALPYATGIDEEDLRWLNELEDLFQKRPKGHADRLTEREQHELKVLVETVQEQ